MTVSSADPTRRGMLQMLAGGAGSVALYTVTAQPAQAELLLPDVVFNAMVQRMGDRPFTEAGDNITFVLPTHAETGYGYICRGEPLADRATKQPVYTVSRFVEKPNISDARRYVDSGEYYWNAGIFVWRTGTIVDEITAHLPALSQGLEEITPALQSADEKDTVKRVYAQLASVTIDHGVLEKSSRLAVMPAAIGWSDLGKWTTIHQFSDQDERGNVLSPSVLDIESENSLVYSSGRTIATIGLNS